MDEALSVSAPFMLSFFRGAQVTVLRIHLPLLCCFAVFHFKPAFSPRLLRAGFTGSITMEPRPYGVASQHAHCAGGADSALETGQLTVVVSARNYMDKPCEPCLGLHSFTHARACWIRRRSSRAMRSEQKLRNGSKKMPFHTNHPSICLA